MTQTRYSDAAGTEVVATTSYVYDALGQILSIEHVDSGEEEIAGYTYEYDAAGQLTSMVDHGVTRDFGYDAQGQLTSENETEYDHDLGGNRSNYEYNLDYYDTHETNQLQSDGTWSYSYDGEGNTIKKVNVTEGDEQRPLAGGPAERRMEKGTQLFKKEVRPLSSPPTIIVVPE